MSAFSLKNNEWVIALLQVYENCYRSEVYKQYENGMVDEFEPDLTTSESIKPLLQFMHQYRVRQGVPPDHRLYKDYADLQIIDKRLNAIDTQVLSEIDEEFKQLNKV